MKKTLLTTCNAKYIHKNLALRWIYTTCPHQEDVILKEYTIKDDIKRIAEDILSMQVEVVCFSCYIWNVQMMEELVQELKHRNPQLYILIGGPEVSFESFDYIDKGVDAISIGEGEKQVWEYIQMLDKDTYEISGIYTKQYPNKEYQRVDISWLEQYSNPYFLDMDKDSMENRYLYLETSRGCPYGCTYCLSSADQCVRMFSMAYIEGLLQQIAQSNVRQVKLLDRTFNANPKRALQIARFMNEHCKNQIFQFEVVAETLSEELLLFFCEEADRERFRFEIGIQSFNKQTLTSVGRIQNNVRLKEVIQRLHNAGCTLHVDLIAGLPYEDMNSFEKSFNEVFDLQAGEVQLGILKLLKGTKLRSQQVEFDFKFQAIAPYDIHSTKWISEQQMKAIHHCADAVEKFWNSHICVPIIRYLLNTRYLSAFQLFMDLGEAYARLPRPYQPYELFECFYPLFENESQVQRDAILLMAYYPRFKQKPQRFTQPHVDLAKKKEVLFFALAQGIANQDQLFRYGVVDVGFDQTMGYQLVLYSKQQTYPKQWFIDYEMTYCKEIE